MAPTVHPSHVAGFVNLPRRHRVTRTQKNNYENIVPHPLPDPHIFKIVFALDYFCSITVLGYVRLMLHAHKSIVAYTGTAQFNMLGKPGFLFHIIVH